MTIIIDYACRRVKCAILDERSFLSVSTRVNILDFIFPKRCLGCGRFGKYFCDQCSPSMSVIGERETVCPMCARPAFDRMTHSRCKTRYSLDGLTSFFRYDGIVKEAIKMLKYRLVTDLATEFVSLIPQVSFSTIQQFNNSAILIPIPLHPSRLRYRGFNQAELLGKLISAKFHIPMRKDILIRTRKTTPQVEMKNRKKRLKNMKDVFALNNLTIQQCNNVTIFLFDDVFTTGATMRAAGETLKRADAKHVWAVTMAR